MEKKEIEQLVKEFNDIPKSYGLEELGDEIGGIKSVLATLIKTIAKEEKFEVVDDEECYYQTQLKLTK